MNNNSKFVIALQVLSCGLTLGTLYFLYKKSQEVHYITLSRTEE